MKSHRTTSSRLSSPKSGSSTKRSTSRSKENEVSLTTLKQQLRETQARLKLSSSELARAELGGREAQQHYQSRTDDLEEQLQRQQIMINELHLANAELGKRLAQQPQPVAVQSSIDELWGALQDVEGVLSLRATRSLTHLESVRRGLVELYKVAEKQVRHSYRRGVVSLLNQIEDDVEAVTEILSTDCGSKLKSSHETKSEFTTESARESIASPVHRVLVAQEGRIKRLEEEREIQAETLKKLEQTLQDQISKGLRLPSPTHTIPSYFPSPDQPLNERIAKVYFSSAGGSQLQEQISALDEEILELQHDLQQALTTR
jgi:hypothetical protein